MSVINFIENKLVKLRIVTTFLALNILVIIKFLSENCSENFIGENNILRYYNYCFFIRIFKWHYYEG